MRRVNHFWSPQRGVKQYVWLNYGGVGSDIFHVFSHLPQCDCCLPAASPLAFVSKYFNEQFDETFNNLEEFCTKLNSLLQITMGNDVQVYLREFLGNCHLLIWYLKNNTVHISHDFVRSIFHRFFLCVLLLDANVPLHWFYSAEILLKYLEISNPIK